MPTSSHENFANAGWMIRTVKSPIMGDKEMDEYRRVLSAMVLPEMVFAQNRVELVHEASGTVISFNALDALAGWKHEDLPPLQVRVAEEWRKAREHEIQQQKAVQLTYDWTYTTPYTCTVTRRGMQEAAAVPAPSPSSPAAAGPGADAAGPRGIPDFVCGVSSTTTATGTTAPGRMPPPPAPVKTSDSGAAAPPAAAGSVPPPAAAGSGSTVGNGGGGGGGTADGAAALWQPTSEQIDRGLLMERDPILFYSEVPLYESDLDDNGVCSVGVKLRVMPRCWLVLLRLWVRVDGSMVRLRETRLFCRHDKPEKRLEVLQEVKHCEGTFAELRSRGAPDEGPSYADADAASQVFQAVAPVGLKLLQTRKLLL
ncbi:hypothetical protein PLESTM_001931200 [Pleodorina starrii]|nr:hypothetical protein PLESTM_001931200 [Pleodorina starrii]